MRDASPDIDYNVVLSEDLRAIVRARKSSASPMLTSAKKDVSGLPPRSHITIWTGTRLRVDGRRPLKMKASPLCSFFSGVPSPATASQSDAEPRNGFRFTVYLSENGNCFGHLSAVPSEQAALRPLHRVAALVSQEDAWNLIEECGSDMAMRISDAVPRTGFADECRMDGPARQFNDLVLKIAPFFENHSNER